MTSSRASRPRAPGYMYAALAAAFIITVAMVTLTTRQAPPPSIAEFAPQAVQQLKETISDGADVEGRGGFEEAERVRLLDEQERDRREAIDVPRVRRCIGDPPRQIEDPQSPPCVPYFQGDNGGATYQGVTRDEIRIALPSESELTEATIQREWKGLRDFFNKRFEFYGRRVRLLPVNIGVDWGRPGASPPQGSQRATMQVAHAAKVDEQVNAFASMPYFDSGGSTVYYDELARRGVASVSALVPREPEAHFRRWHPYQWSYIQTLDQAGANVAEFICRQLAGGGSVEWGGPGQQGKPRVFGLLVTDYHDGSPDTSEVLAGLKSCGVEPAVVHQLYKHGDYQDDFAEGQRAAIELNSRGVTTVICLCHAMSWCLYTMPGATDQGYFPEWVTMSFPFVDNGRNVQLCPKEQMNQAFGLSGFSKWVPTQDLPVTWAMKETDPSFNWPDDVVPHDWQFRRYTPLLLLMSGLQLAGPNLTPHTFAQGLQRTRFANPETPWFASSVGFSGDHTMSDDYATVWWDSDAQSTWGGAGAWCYADRGLRHRLGSWPKARPNIFQGPCY